MRVRLPVFALVAIGTVLIAIIPFPHDARREISIAGVIFFALVAAAFLLPWDRLPDWAWLIIPIGYIAVIAIIRDAQGGSDSGLVVVYLLPIVWLSLYGRRLHLLVGLFCMDLALLVPLLIVGPPKYPTLEWRQVAVMATVTTLVASTVYTMVSRDRAFLTDSGPAIPYRPPERPRSRLCPRPPRDPAAGGHRERHHGCRPCRDGDVLLGRSRTDARLPRRRGGGVPLHRRLHRPRPDRRAAPDDRRHADRARTRRRRDGGRGSMDGNAQGRPAAPLRRAGPGPARPDAGPVLDEEWGDEAESVEQEAVTGRNGGRPRTTGSLQPTAATWSSPSTSPSARSWPPTGSASTPFRRKSRSRSLSRTTACAS